MTLWTYQVDPSNFLMEGMLPEARNHDHRVALQPRDGGDHVSIGDLAYLCETDKLKTAGLIGVARIESLPANILMPEWQQKFWIGKNFDPKKLYPHVWMTVLHVCNKLSRPQFRSNQILRNTNFSSGYQGTMRSLSEGQSREIDRLIGFTRPD